MPCKIIMDCLIFFWKLCPFFSVFFFKEALKAFLERSDKLKIFPIRLLNISRKTDKSLAVIPQISHSYVEICLKVSELFSPQMVYFGRNTGRSIIYRWRGAAQLQLKTEILKISRVRLAVRFIWSPWREGGAAAAWRFCFSSKRELATEQ